MKQGGFHGIISNPPYVRIQALKEWAAWEAEYFKQRYQVARKGNYDIYLVFVERCLSLLHPQGHLGFILPSKFFTTDYGEPLRGLISERAALTQVVDLGQEQVFKDASTYTCLLFLARAPSPSFSYRAVQPATALGTPGTWSALTVTTGSGVGVASGTTEAQEIRAASVTSAPWTFRSIDARGAHISSTADGGGPEEGINLDRLGENAVPLLELPSKISQGSSTGADQVFMLTLDRGQLRTRDGRVVDIEDDILRIPLYATDFGRYRFAPVGKERIIFPYYVRADGYSAMSHEELVSKYPLALEYLESRRPELEARKQYSHWFGYSAPRSLDLHDTADLVVPLLAEKGSYSKLPGT